MSKPIGVGIIGANPEKSWAALAHIPALKSLPEFRIAALSTSRKESALAAAKLFGVDNAFDNHIDLVNHPDVDLVVVAVKVPQHLELVSAALRAGKAVYCEWPLGNGLAETLDLAEMARQAGVVAAIGLQARAAPAVNYVRDLIRDGYVGEVLSTTLVGSGMNWGQVIEQNYAYTADASNGVTMLSIAIGHTMDAVCYCLGEVSELTATMAQRRTSFTVLETQKSEPMTSADQVAFSGLLQGGAAFSVHYRGGMSRGTNMLWEINGTEGDIQMSAVAGQAQMFELSVSGARGDSNVLAPLTVPSQYYWVPEQPEPGFSLNVAQAYSRLARDIREGTQLCATFDDAVLRHRLIHAVEEAASSGIRRNIE